MRRALTLFAIMVLVTTPSVASIIVTVDENGNGSADGVGLTFTPPYTISGTSGAVTYPLTYNLPSSFASAVTAGDIELYEDATSTAQLSDVITFFNGTVSFRSDNSDGVDSLADIGFVNSSSLVLVETNPEGGPSVEGGINGLFNYTPLLDPLTGLSQPGYVDDPVHPGTSLVTYNFISDSPVPEPTTLIAGALLLLPFGVSTLRMLRKNRAA